MAKTEDRGLGSERMPEQKSGRNHQETLYSAAELEAAHQTQFHCRREVVAAALRKAGKQEYSLEDAKRIVDAFRRKKVKRKGE